MSFESQPISVFVVVGGGSGVVVAESEIVAGTTGMPEEPSQQK